MRERCLRWGNRMGRWLACAALALTSGCYDFEAPLDPAPKVDLDPALFGSWRCLPSQARPTSEAISIVFGKARDLVYAVTFDESGKEEGHFEAYASLIKDHTVLNVRQIPAPKSKPWSFVRYSLLLPDVLRFQLVDDEPFKDVEPTTPSLRAALERLDGKPGLYVDFCICVRVVPERQK